MNTTKAVLAHLLEQLVDRMPEVELTPAEERAYRDEQADYDPGTTDGELAEVDA